MAFAEQNFNSGQRYLCFVSCRAKNKKRETVMGLVSVKQFSEQHNIDGGTLRRLIAQGRIPAVKVGNQWCIPADTPRPEDRRVKSGKYIGWRKKPEA
jgi:excisionase family DNA binding protein